MDSPQELNELAAQRVGKVLVDKWRLERVLGMGGMATVYAASHRNNLRAVAIKLLHPDLAANQDLRKRFLREGYIANKVGHWTLVWLNLPTRYRYENRKPKRARKRINK